ncbi:MAG: CPBP family intramembrane metalloprotease [Methylobacter sp.]|nr:MAG: CPBP family intramembrane metalloprotease [Methylobacter sp.]PPD36248.1 MAG: CPBP family intramembrane metalloprotease [Methylomonas sp.]
MPPQEPNSLSNQAFASPWPHRKRLAIEFTLVFLGIPLLILALKIQILMFIALWAGGIAAYYFCRRQNLQSSHWRSGIASVLRRFACFAPLIVVLSWYLAPHLFLALPRQQPLLWLAVMVLYPALSVWPQEIIYRRLIYHRYQPLFGQGAGYIAVSAITFGYAHLIMINWLAIAMTTAGGYIFASDYAARRSLILVCLEHALYGCLIFTVGLGRYFYTGSVWHH